MKLNNMPCIEAGRYILKGRTIYTQMIAGYDDTTKLITRLTDTPKGVFFMP